jgi:hypothetical protein
MVECGLSFMFLRSPHGGECLAGWGRGGGGIRVFGRALAQGVRGGNGMQRYERDDYQASIRFLLLALRVQVRVKFSFLRLLQQPRSG